MRLDEWLGDTSPNGVQHLLARARWDVNEARNILQQWVIEHLGSNKAILILDETGFIKKGEHSAGVQRQYSGTAGRVENSQIGVFLCYSGKGGRAFIDRELYLPKPWIEDRERCQQAGIPDEVSFASKPELAQRMLGQAFEAGVVAPAGSVEILFTGVPAGLCGIYPAGAGVSRKIGECFRSPLAN
ncbi:MAG: transposase [Candidatus Symbiodolus clandestinus]